MNENDGQVTLGEAIADSEIETHPSYPLITKQEEKHLDLLMIACLVLVIFISIIPPSLLSPSLPSLLSQTNKAKQAEARKNVGAMNRAQQAYFLEKNTFTNSFENLGKNDLKTETENFTYWIRTSGKYVFNYATPRKPNLRNYVGIVYLIPESFDGNEILTQGILCESPSTDTNAIIYKNGVPECTKQWR